MKSGAVTAISRCEYLETDDVPSSSYSNEGWLSRVREIAPTLLNLGTHAERVGLLLGCAAFFARKAGLTKEQFEEFADCAWLSSTGVKRSG